MRLVSRSLTVLALLATALAPWARAEDAPGLPRPVPPPRPEVAGLLDRLLAEDGDVRAAAEKAVAKAPPDVLRILLFAMRDRAGRAERAAGPGRPSAAAPEETRSDRGVEQSVHFVTLTAEAATRLLGVSGATTDAVHRVLPRDQAKALVTAFEKERGLTIHAAPRVTAYDRQKASVEMLDQRSYVADFEVEVRGGSATADPVIAVYRTGMRLETRARILHDGSTIAAGLDLDLTRCVDPVAQEEVPTTGSLPAVKVQRPEIVGSRWSRTFTVPAGHTLLVVLPSSFSSAIFATEPGRRLVLLYAPSVVPLDAGVPVPVAPASPGAK